MYNSLNETNSTIIKWQGVELRTTQDPYIAGNQYQAEAVDKDENEYMVYWDVLDGWEELEDESEACDWDNPVEVKQL